MLLVASFPPLWRGSDYVGFAADEEALGYVFTRTSVSLANHSTECSILIIIYHPRLIQ
jgi:hypothetical protein